MTKQKIKLDLESLIESKALPFLQEAMPTAPWYLRGPIKYGGYFLELGSIGYMANAVISANVLHKIDLGDMFMGFAAYLVGRYLSDKTITLR